MCARASFLNHAHHVPVSLNSKQGSKNGPVDPGPNNSLVERFNECSTHISDARLQHHNNNKTQMRLTFLREGRPPRRRET